MSFLFKKKLFKFRYLSVKLQEVNKNLYQEYSRNSEFLNIEAEYNNIKKRKKRKLVLGVTTGRSGMKWVYEIFNAHENARGGGERNVIPESFYRYVKYNKLPIDDSGILNITKKDILNDWMDSELSITVSPYFSHECGELYRRLKADYMIWGITDPEFTVTSCFNKGLYLFDSPPNPNGLIMGYDPQYTNEWSHFLGRIVPHGDFFKEWKKLTRVGKISWFLNTIHMEIYLNVEKMDKSKIWIFDLSKSDQNYLFYLKLADAFHLKPLLGESKFLSLKKTSAFEHENVKRVWTQQEKSEFEYYAKDYIQLYNSGYFDDSKFMNSK